MTEREGVPQEQSGEQNGQIIRELKDKGIRVDFAMKLPVEIDKQTGAEVPAEIYWVRWPRPEGEANKDLLPVEGKIYLPKQPNKELIIWTPGFPGGDSGRVERLYAKTFAESGYAFATIRHNGAPLQHPESSASIMNSPERLALANQRGEKFIGGEKPTGYGMTELVYEPVVAFEALQKNFERVHLLGQSFGATSSWNSVDRLRQTHPEAVKKIGNMISVAGWLGAHDRNDTTRLKGMKVKLEDIYQREVKGAAEDGVNIDTDHDRMLATFRELATRTEQVQIPDHVGQIAVISPEDPLIALPETEWQEQKDEAVAEDRLVRTLVYPGATRKSLVIKDETALGKPKQHSMLWIAPENLLRAVRAKVSARGPHYVGITGKGQPKAGNKNI